MTMADMEYKNGALCVDKFNVADAETYSVDNPEWLEAKIDSSDNIIYGTQKDGTVFTPKIYIKDYLGMSNSVKKELIDSIPGSLYIKSIKEYDKVTYGSSFQNHENNLDTYGYVVCFLNSYVNEDGWLTNVKFYSTKSSTKTIYIGYIDQRTTAIVRHSFTVSATQGYNDIDVSNKKIIIKKDETLLVSANGIGYGDVSVGDNQKHMYSGQLNGVLSEYQASLYFNWDVVSIDALYPYVEDFENMEKNLVEVSNIANESYKNINKILDSSGNIYKFKIEKKETQTFIPRNLKFKNGLLVDDNDSPLTEDVEIFDVNISETVDVTPILQQFKKALVIGNSVTKHGYARGTTAWLSSDKGMASTIIYNDFCQRLEDGLKTKDSSASVTRGSGYNWERNLPTDASTLYSYLNSYNDDYDLIIFACSENIGSTSQEEIYLSAKEFFKVIMSKWKNSELIITSTRLCMGASETSSYSYKDMALMRAARELGLLFVDVRQRKYDAFVTNFNTGQWVPLYCSGDDGVFPAQKIVHSHTCDIGMLRIANAILEALSYPTIENVIYNINVTCSQDYYAPNYWLEKGLVTVFCYDSLPLQENVSIVDSDSNNIEFQIKDMREETLYDTPSKVPIGAIIFYMPNKNVNITIN